MPLFVVGVVLASTVTHACWNLLAKDARSSPRFFLHVLVTLAVPGTLFALVGEARGPQLLPHIWPVLIGAGLFEALYFAGLTFGYRAGDLSVVYPLARALPVALLALFDLLRGRPPSLLGWLGLLLVVAGCLLTAQPARDGRPDGARGGWRRWLAPALAWAAVAAVGTAGYSVFDKLAAEAIVAALGSSPVFALRYALWEFAAAAVLYAPLLAALEAIGRRRRAARSRVAAGPRPAAAPESSPDRASGLRTAIITGIAATLMFGTYTLVLWAYQMSSQASYVVALRQFSVVLGVVWAGRFMGEGARVQRLTAASIIVAGTAIVAVAAAA